MAQPGLIKIFVRSPDRGQFVYELNPNSTVGGLKAKVGEDMEAPASRVRLIHRGRELEQDSETLGQLNLPETVVFHCALRAAPVEQRRGGAGGRGGGRGAGRGGAGRGGQEDRPMVIPANMMPGMGGIMGQIGIQGGAGEDAVNRIHQAVSQMFGNAATGNVVVGRGAGEQRARGNQNNSNVSTYANPPTGFGGMPFMYPFGPDGQSIPGLSSETVARGGDPILDSNGRYTQRSVFGGLDEMLLRLQNGNMARDNGPALFLARRDRILPGNSTNAWTQAAHTFLQSCRTILSNTNLNRETLAAVNRIFSAAGLRPLALGVRSFPINTEDEDRDNMEWPALGAGAGRPRRRGYSDDGNDDESDGIPALIDSEAESGSYNSEDYSEDDEEEDSDEEESEDEDALRHARRAARYVMLGSEGYYSTSSEEEEETSEEDEDSDEDEEDEEEDSDWETEASDSDEPPDLVTDEDEAEPARRGGARGRGRAAARATSAAAAAAARRSGRGSDASSNDSPPPLVSDPDEQEPQPRPLGSRSRGAGGRDRGNSGQQSGARNSRNQSRRSAAAAGRGGGGSDSGDSMPGLVSDEDDSDMDSDDSGRRNVRQRTAEPGSTPQRARGAARAGGGGANRRRGAGAGTGAAASGGRSSDTAWFTAMPDNDLILVAAVTVGELARRFMSVIGQEISPVQINAMIMRLAIRLRSLSSLEGVGRMELARQISLVAGHLGRIAAAGAELGRSMEYLHSAFATNNLYFLQMVPGYITFEQDRPASNMSVMRTGPDPTDVVAGGFMLGNSPHMHSAVQTSVRIVPLNINPSQAAGGAAAAGGGRPGATAASGGATATASGQSGHTGVGGRFVFTSSGGPTPTPSATSVTFNVTPASTTGPAPAPARAQGRARGPVPLRSSLASLTEVARHLVNSTVHDIPALTNEIAAAVTSSVGQGISSATGTTTPSSTTLASRTTAAVEDVLRRHFTHIIDAPEVQGHSRQLQELLGVDVAEILRNIGTSTATAQQQEGQEEEGDLEVESEATHGLSAEAPAFVPTGGATAATATAAEATAAATAVAAQERINFKNELERILAEPDDTLAGAGGSSAAAVEEEKEEQAEAAAAPVATAAEASGSQEAPRGPSLPARPSSRGGPSLPARRPRAAGAGATPAASTTAAPPAPAPVSSGGLPAGLGDLLGAAAAGGSSGGLGGMLQSMMSSPGIGELARNPSMQQAAGQLFGGGGGAGRGLDFGALMNSPIVSQLMGGGMAAPAASQAASGGGAGGAAAAGGGGGGSARRTAASPSSGGGGDLDVTLASALTAEEAARWKTIMDADDDATQRAAAAASGVQHEEGLSDAYYAAMPPRAASGLLQGLLGGQE